MPKRKIFYYLTIFFTVFLTIASINVRAHPPSDMTLEINSSTNILKVSITHGVSDNTTHYIYSVEISVNGSVDQTHIYTNQTDLAFFFYEYTIITNDGSTIQVTSVCIEGGSLTRTLVGSGTPGDAIPGYLGLYIVITISAITLIILTRKKLNKV